MKYKVVTGNGVAVSQHSTLFRARCSAAQRLRQWRAYTSIHSGSYGYEIAIVIDGNWYPCTLSGPGTANVHVAGIDD